MRRLLEGIQSLPIEYQDKIIGDYIRMKCGIERKHTDDPLITMLLELYDKNVVYKNDMKLVVIK